MYEIQCQGRGVELKVELDPQIETSYVYMDEQRILQVMNNLVSNALKFTPRGGSIVLSGRLNDGQVELRVKDTGRGIKEENQAKLFKMFGKLEDKDRINDQGTGLGLLICRDIMIQMDGSIKLESEFGKGTTGIV